MEKPYLCSGKGAKQPRGLTSDQSTLNLLTPKSRKGTLNMQGIGIYCGWEEPTYTIQCTPEEVYDLRIALKALRRLTNYNHSRSDKWLNLLNEMIASDFGFEKTATDVF